MSIAARLEELPRPMWIALAILGFILWWPLGLAIMVYILWSGKMKCCQFAFPRPNQNGDDVEETRDRSRQPRTSGNRAFDEYRAETLRRLEDEHRAFQEYLDRLRLAKDRAEFDEFMAKRGVKPDAGPHEEV